MSSAISRAEVEHLAQLARIDLSPEELDQFATQLPAILEHVAVVQQAAADVTPMSHPSGVENVYRPDEVRESLTAEQALAGAPESAEQRFMVPKILGED